MQHLNNQFCNLSTSNPLKDKGSKEFFELTLLIAIDETVEMLNYSSKNYIDNSNQASNAHLLLDYSHHNRVVHSPFQLKSDHPVHSISNDYYRNKGLIGDFTIKTNSSGISPPFKWSDKALERLLRYLKKNIDKVRALDKRNSDGTKHRLWEGASKELCNESHEYNPIRCSIKWKNVKQNYIKWINESSKNDKKPDVEKIIDNELLKLTYDETTRCNKQKRMTDEEDNPNRKIPRKRKTI